MKIIPKFIRKRQKKSTFDDKLFHELLSLNQDYRDKLEKSGIKFKDIPKRIGFNSVEITYKDKSTKKFEWYVWLIFRDGIVKNLYNKGLCKIKFLNEK